MTDLYVLKGQGEEVWQPRFRGQGTRHAEITGFPGRLKAENVEFLVMHTDMEKVGHFECSCELLNKIYANVVRSMRDAEPQCGPMEPDRDERMPWLGHPSKTSESEAYVFGVAPFYRNFLTETRNHQGQDGLLSDAGYYWEFYSGDVIWPSVIAIVPDWYHQFYGDRRILAENFDAMRRWMEYHAQHNLLPDNTVKASTYGDWVDAYNAEYRASEAVRTSLPLMATAYFYHNCRIVRERPASSARPKIKTGSMIWPRKWPRGSSSGSSGHRATSTKAARSVPACSPWRLAWCPRTGGRPWQPTWSTTSCPYTKAISRWAWSVCNGICRH